MDEQEKTLPSRLWLGFSVVMGVIIVLAPFAFCLGALWIVFHH